MLSYWCGCTEAELEGIHLIAVDDVFSGAVFSEPFRSDTAEKKGDGLPKRLDQRAGIPLHLCGCTEAELDGIDLIAVDDVFNASVCEQPLSRPTSRHIWAPAESKLPKRLDQKARSQESPVNRRSAGQVCVHLTHPVGERAAARYHLDEQAGCFVLELGEGFDVPKISCHVNDIEDVYQISDGEECFPSAILSSLAPHERDSLFMLVVKHPVSQVPTSICLLEESRCGLEDMLLRLGRVLWAHSKGDPVRAVMCAFA